MAFTWLSHLSGEHRLGQSHPQHRQRFLFHLPDGTGLRPSIAGDPSFGGLQCRHFGVSGGPPGEFGT